MDPKSEIREFLTACRARLTPEQAGLTVYGDNRRVPGLRREEAAMLAGVSADYYTSWAATIEPQPASDRPEPRDGPAPPGRTAALASAPRLLLALILWVGLTDSAPGSTRALYAVVEDLEAARDELSSSRCRRLRQSEAAVR